MHIFRIIKLIYAALLRLYPYRFQTEFRDEMQAVFAATISDAARAGVMSAIVACLRELRDLPMNLLREHWLNYEEAFMSNFHFSSDPRRSALWGALGFGVAFALAKTISVGWLSASVILYALAGAIGGALFCVAGESRKHIRLFASIGALAFGIGHLVASLMTIFLATNVSPDSAVVPFILVLLEPVTIGALVGILIGAVWNDWKRMKHLALASIVRFGLGRLAGLVLSLIVWGIGQAMDSYRSGLNGQISSWLVSMMSVMTITVASVVSGIVGGAVLGLNIGSGHQGIDDSLHPLT